MNSTRMLPSAPGVMNQTPSAILSGSTRPAAGAGAAAFGGGPPPREGFPRTSSAAGLFGLYVGDPQFQGRISALPLHDVHRKHHAAKVSVLRIDPLEQRVAGKADIHLRLDTLDETALAEGPSHGVFAERHERKRSSAANGRRLRRGGIGGDAFQKPVRRQPDVDRACLGASLRRLVLDDVARNGADATLARRGVEAAGATATGRPLVVDSDELLSHGRHCVVHRHHISGDRELRPWAARRECLARRIGRSGSRVLNRLQTVRAHRGRGRSEDGADFLRRALASGRTGQKHRRRYRDSDLLHRSSLPALPGAHSRWGETGGTGASDKSCQSNAMAPVVGRIDG